MNEAENFSVIGVTYLSVHDLVNSVSKCFHSPFSHWSNIFPHWNRKFYISDVNILTILPIVKTF